MTAVRDNTRGIIAMNVAMLSFILSDTLVKYVTQSMPLGEAIFLRGFFASILLGAMVAWTGSWRAWRHLLTGRMALRTAGEIGSTMFYLLALVHMPMANATAVFQITPLAMTAAAALFLGEKVGPRRWIAIAIGFVGVMVIVRPGFEGFDVWSLSVFAGVSCVVLRDITSARIPAAAPATLITLVSAVVVTLLGLCLRPFEQHLTALSEWVMPDRTLLLLLVLNGVALTCGNAFMLNATRWAETSAIAPFRYALLAWAFLFGVLVFGQYPDVPTLVGTAIVVGTGLYTYHRERLRRSESSES